MAEWLTVHNDGAIVPDPDGDYAERTEMEKALALIAEMKELLAYTAPFCEMRDDYEACMLLVARAEELLK